MHYPNIKKLRENKEYSQTQIAKKLNCSQRAYSHYELGSRDIPTQILIDLSRIYQVSTDFILGICPCPLSLNYLSTYNESNYKQN